MNETQENKPSHSAGVDDDIRTEFLAEFKKLNPETVTQDSQPQAEIQNETQPEVVTEHPAETPNELEALQAELDKLQKRYKEVQSQKDKEVSSKNKELKQVFNILDSYKKLIEPVQHMVSFDNLSGVPQAWNTDIVNTQPMNKVEVQPEVKKLELPTSDDFLYNPDQAKQKLQSIIDSKVDEKIQKAFESTYKKQQEDAQKKVAKVRHDKALQLAQEAFPDFGKPDSKTTQVALDLLKRFPELVNVPEYNYLTTALADYFVKNTQEQKPLNYNKQSILNESVTPNSSNSNSNITFDKIAAMSVDQFQNAFLENFKKLNKGR